MDNINALLSNPTRAQWGAAALAIISVGLVYTKSKSRHYPPGPPKLPLIGNAHNFPSDNWGDVFKEWQELYGDIVYVQLPGMALAILNSSEVAQELLNKRAKFNSDRKMGYMITKLMGWENTPQFRDADTIHTTERTMYKRGIGPTKMPLKDHLIETQSQQLALSLPRIKGHPKNAIIKILGLTLTELAYGHGIVKDHGEELLARVVEVSEILDRALRAVWAVDLFPLLRFWPSWMPGGQFKRHAAHNKQLLEHIHEWPFQLAIERHKAGTLGHCLADDLINEFGTRFEVRDTLASLYFAGADTTSSVIVRALHDMFLFPEIAKKVQAEIDSVTSRERLPKVKDRANLPYTNAVWKESLRFKCVVHVGGNRTTQRDEWINGYLIPKGSVILPNMSAMFSNPGIWGDPEVFRPERFLSSEASLLPDPTILAFGFGTRVCPGMYFADRTGFHMLTTVMALFNIEPLPGESIPPYTEVEYTRGAFRFPAKFDCNFTPRDAQAIQLLSSIALDQ